MALVNPKFKESIVNKITKEYLETFPQYTDTFKVEFCYSVDGLLF